MKCSTCKRVTELHTGVKHGKFYENLCVNCVGNLGSAEFYRRHDRQSQRRTHAREILQPDEPEYVKAYGANNARTKGWSEDQIRKLI